MSTSKTPEASKTDRDEVVGTLPEAPARVTQVSRRRMRDEVFRHDWNSISDEERAARVAAISAAAISEGPVIGPTR